MPRGPGQGCTFSVLPARCGGHALHHPLHPAARPVRPSASHTGGLAQGHGLAPVLEAVSSPCARTPSLCAHLCPGPFSFTWLRSDHRAAMVRRRAVRPETRSLAPVTGHVGTRKQKASSQARGVLESSPPQYLSL